MTTAEQALRASIAATKELGGGQEAVDAAIARNVLHEELGYFDDPPTPTYNLTDEMRDRLLAHARQDASHAAIAATSAYREAKKARNFAFLALIVSCISLAVLLWGNLS